MNSVQRAGMRKSMNIDSNDLARGYTGEPNTIQKSIDQIGIDAIVGIVRPHGNLEFCDMHGYYAVDHPSITDEPASTVVTCPICSSHTQEGEGTRASEVELFIDLKDSLNAATTIIE